MSVSEPFVNVEQGKLKGKIAVDLDGNAYYSFQGIPYAKPPIGDLRFKAPQPPESWNGIWDATKEGNKSVQKGSSVNNILIGNEDCLYLNVYTKKLYNDDAELKPVMFWIHGGGFWSGSGGTDLHSPDYLLTEDVVVVTINYRLGLLGFLSFEDLSLEVPGNAGFKDMVMALKWVQKNIHQFKGDPNNVTIFGESAGGAAVHLMTVSPMAKGLFHKVIAQSGTAISPWAYCVRRAEKFAAALEYYSSNEKDLFNFFKNIPAEKLIEAVDKVTQLNDKLSFRVIGPIIEVPSTDLTETAFLTELPETSFKNGNFQKLPTIIGFTDSDGMVYASKAYEDKQLPVNFTDLESLVPKDMHLARGSEKSKEVGFKIKRFYYGTETPSRSNEFKNIKLQTDLKFTLVTAKAVRLQQAASTEPIYMYVFSVDTKFNIYKKFIGMNYPGAAHGDELGYLFKTKFTPKTSRGSLEDITIRRLVKFWTNFARTGNPNPVKPDPLINVTWEPLHLNKLNHIDIGMNLKMVNEKPHSDRLNFWDELYSSLK